MHQLFTKLSLQNIQGTIEDGATIIVVGSHWYRFGHPYPGDNPRASNRGERNPSSIVMPKFNRVAFFQAAKYQTDARVRDNFE
jgi:hypothetical protein